MKKKIALSLALAMIISLIPGIGLGFMPVEAATFPSQPTYTVDFSGKRAGQQNGSVKTWQGVVVSPSTFDMTTNNVTHATASGGYVPNGAGRILTPNTQIKAPFRIEMALSSNAAGTGNPFVTIKVNGSEVGKMQTTNNPGLTPQTLTFDYTAITGNVNLTFEPDYGTNAQTRSRIVWIKIYEGTGSSNPLGAQGGAWNESAWLTWNRGSYTAFNAYVKESSQSDTAANWKKIDDPLVRTAGGTIWQANFLGLKHGVAYDLKVVAVSNGNEVASTASIVTRITPTAYDRSGFAFSSQSPRGIANGNKMGGTGSWSVGAYNADGTLASNAVVVYVTPSHPNGATVDANGKLRSNGQIVVLNDAGSATKTFQGVATTDSSNQNFLFRPSSKAGYANYTSRPLVIRYIGTLGAGQHSALTNGAPNGTRPLINDYTLGMLYMREAKNMTIEGVGNDARLFGWGLRFMGCDNIEVRNLTVDFPFEDGLSFEGGGGSNLRSNNIWAHNNVFTPGQDQAKLGGESDKNKGDGALDVKFTSWFTISYNRFNQTAKTNLAGSNNAEMGNEWWHGTYHNNWYLNSGSRAPRIRDGNVDVYNNYFQSTITNTSAYSIGAGNRAMVQVEGNYFERVHRPMIISGRGNALSSSGSNTLSTDAAGAIRLGSVANTLDNVTGYNQSTDTGNGGMAYRNWDFNTYPRTVTSASAARQNVMQRSGVMPAPTAPKAMSESIVEEAPQLPAYVTYTVSFDSQGGTWIAPIDGVPDNAGINAPEDPKKENATFAGWYKEAECINEWDFDLDTVASDTTLFAKWTSDAAVDTSGGSEDEESDISSSSEAPNTQSVSHD